MTTPETSSILLTGHLGYIGSVMAAVPDGCRVSRRRSRHRLLRATARSCPTGSRSRRSGRTSVTSTADDVRGFDAVVHLAALSNDPIGNLDERWTEEINHDATVRLAELAREAGVRRFLFSSSCIMYGMSSANVVDEESPLDPQTEYARSKVKSEDGAPRARGRRVLADVSPERHRLRSLAADAIRHGPQRSRGAGLHDRPDHRLQRRQAVAAGRPRRGRRAELRARSRSAASSSSTTRPSTTAQTT